jgi:hypothetical protein
MQTLTPGTNRTLCERSAFTDAGGHDFLAREHQRNEVASSQIDIASGLGGLL